MSVFVYTGGKPHKAGQPTMLFVHGAANDHSVWALQSRYFAHHGWNVVAPDLPAHGRSSGAALAGVPEIAQWCERLLDSHGVTLVNESPRSLAIIGHSMGSLAALNLAARFGSRCSHLALLGAAAPMAVGDVLLEAAKDEPDRAYRMICQWSYSATSHLGGNKSPGMWKAGAGLALMRRTKAGVLHQDLLNCRHYIDGIADAKNINAKTLMIGGAKDLMTPPKASAELAKTLGVTPYMLPDCGHTMMSERPEEVLSALSRFVASS
jgi:pimeloyl-ACP methyl ester carboxylesterase